MGTQSRTFSENVWLSFDDAQLVKEDEEFTLKSWGNVIVTSVEREDGRVTAIGAKLHLAGDFKTTALKATWVPRVGAGVPGNDSGHLVDILIQVSFVCLFVLL
jgi:glutamyl-tRNA synthetase